MFKLTRFDILKLVTGLLGVAASFFCLLSIGIGLSYHPNTPISEFWPWLVGLGLIALSTLASLFVQSDRATPWVLDVALLVMGGVWITLGLGFTIIDAGDAILYLPIAGLGVCLLKLRRMARAA